MWSWRGSGSETVGGGLDAGGDEDVVSLAEVAFLDAVEGAIDGAGREAVFFRPLADGFALAAKLGLEERN